MMSACFDPVGLTAYPTDPGDIRDTSNDPAVDVSFDTPLTDQTDSDGRVMDTVTDAATDEDSSDGPTDESDDGETGQDLMPDDDDNDTGQDGGITSSGDEYRPNYIVLRPTGFSDSSDWQYGTSIAVNSQFLVVGAPRPTSTGAAFVYSDNGSTFESFVTLETSDLADPTGDDMFGAAVDLEGGTLAIARDGAVSELYVVELGEHGEYAEVPVAGFESLATATTNLALGEEHLAIAQATGTRVQLLKFDVGWEEGQDLGPINAGLTTPALALTDDFLVVGHVSADAIPRMGGSVSIYSRALDWGPTQRTIPSPNGTVDDRFGSSVAASGLDIVVGAPGVNGRGEVYVFTQSGESDEFLLTATISPNRSRGSFGDSVAISGDRIVVGDPSNASVRFYERNETRWRETPMVLPPELVVESEFGATVEMSGDVVVVGAPRAEFESDKVGAAYVFWWCEYPMHGSDCTLSCADETINGFETAVDCGGSVCPGCGAESACSRDEDCAPGFSCVLDRCN